MAIIIPNSAGDIIERAKSIKKLKDSIYIKINIKIAIKALKINFWAELLNDLVPKLINSVIIPGMGVGSGKMPYVVAAKQMRIAYESIILGKSDFPKDWMIAVEDHESLIN